MKPIFYDFAVEKYEKWDMLRIKHSWGKDILGLFLFCVEREKPWGMFGTERGTIGEGEMKYLMGASKCKKGKMERILKVLVVGWTPLRG